MEQWAQCHVDIYNALFSKKNSFRLKAKLSEHYYFRCQIPLCAAIQAIKEQDDLKVDVALETLSTINMLAVANREFLKDPTLIISGLAIATKNVVHKKP